MKFQELCTYFDKVESVSSRLEMTDILAELFGKCTREEVSIVCYLLTGRIVPMFIPVEFNVADKTVLRVLEGMARGCGSRKDIRKLYDRVGDLGLVALEVAGLCGKKRHTAMSVREMYNVLWDIATVSGSGSMEVRDRKIGGLLGELKGIEAKYIVRVLLQQMRLGSSSKTVLDSLSVLKVGDKGEREELDRAFGVCSDLGYVAAVYVESGSAGIKKIGVTPGIPVASMLVEREKGAEEIMKRIPKAIIQPKFDGLRCQIHIGVEKDQKVEERVWTEKWNATNGDDMQGFFGSSTREGRVRLFSRNLEDMTKMFPEIVEAAQAVDVTSGIFDTEVIGYNDETSEFLPFQETMMRKRKYGVGDASRRVPVKAFVFDVIALNGKSMIAVENGKRIETISGIISKKGVIVASSNHMVSTAKETQKIFDEYVSEGLEGVIVKDPGSFYKPGKRGFDWIKLKRASQGHLADTVDVVILGYYFGRGRQADFGIGAILGGVYDAKADEFVTIAKIGTGVTDEQWKEVRSDLDQYRRADAPNQVSVNPSLVPDRWVEPVIVATIEADEITKSPVHTAGADSSGTGFALRFPRLKEWKRDKQPDDVTHVKEIVEMYGKQG